MQTSIRLNTARVTLLMLFVAACFGGGLAWSIKTIDNERASWGPPLPARVSHITEKDKTYTTATVVVTGRDGQYWTYTGQEFDSPIVEGQGMRAWFHYTGAHQVFIENADGSNGFHVLPYPGWFSKLTLAVGVMLAGLLLGLAVLRARKVAREPAALGQPFIAMKAAVRSHSEEDYFSTWSILLFLLPVGIVLLLVLTKAGTEDLRIVEGVTGTDVVYGAALIAGTAWLYRLLARAVPWLRWTWAEAINDEVGFGKLDVTRFSWFFTIYGVILFSFWPLVAQDEEQFFRGGTHGWVPALWRSFWWGFVYCLIGMPLAAGLATIAAGLVFSEIYFSGGIHQAIEVHTVYNAIALGAFGTVVAYGWWKKRGSTTQHSAPAT